ncbi:MAG: glycoside hydrolase family 31 protein [Phycisphaerales bacterium]
MHFHKQPSPDCLAPIERLAPSPNEPDDSSIHLTGSGVDLRVRAGVGDYFHLTVNRLEAPLPRYTPVPAGAPAAFKGKLERDDSATTLTGADGARFRVDHKRLTLSLTHATADGVTLEVIPHDDTQIIGFCGDKFGVGLRLPEKTPFYGFGEKTGRLNKQGARMKFWTVDVCADHPYGACRDDYDPTYCSIPVAYWRVASEDGAATAWAAALIDNGGASWFNCQSNDFLEDRFFYFGTYSGEPSFYFVTGDTLAEVAAKILRLTGDPAMPPLWALGHHQCRWGYDEVRMYQHIVKQYIEHEIPLSSLWLDIDYMDRYRVFTWHPERVPDPKALAKWMHECGVRLTTIIDPGVAAVEGDETYEDGREKDLFCLAASGREFIGMVWPGKTVFPDYTRSDAREWWADRIAAHLAMGVDGIWNDMNDPAAGAADLDDMRFDRGQVDHAYFHNLYGTFMAEATWLGYERHDPDTRPFILTRSASTGIQRFAAVWTGDNCSSWAHLRMSIPESVNLSLSGVSFNGPDIGGFMENTNGELLTRWYQAAVLFPFFRNHSNNGTAHQEPWCFGTATREIIRETVLLRYRLLGALYSEFARHLETGEPVMRPMCWFSDDRAYRDVDDQYAIGSDIVVAPVVHAGAERRHVLLPPGKWFDLTASQWRDGDALFDREAPIGDLPLFIRKGTIIAEPIPTDHESFVGWDHDLTRCHWRIHLFGDPSSGAQLVDDGRTRQAGAPARSTIRYEAGELEGDFPFGRVVEVIAYDAAVSGRMTVGGNSFADAEPEMALGRGFGGTASRAWRRE